MLLNSGRNWYSNIQREQYKDIFNGRHSSNDFDKNQHFNCYQQNANIRKKKQNKIQKLRKTEAQPVDNLEHNINNNNGYWITGNFGKSNENSDKNNSHDNNDNDNDNILIPKHAAKTTTTKRKISANKATKTDGKHQQAGNLYLFSSPILYQFEHSHKHLHYVRSFVIWRMLVMLFSWYVKLCYALTTAATSSTATLTTTTTTATIIISIATVISKSMNAVATATFVDNLTHLNQNTTSLTTSYIYNNNYNSINNNNNNNNNNDNINFNNSNISSIDYTVLVDSSGGGRSNESNLLFNGNLSGFNDSLDLGEDTSEYIFDRTDVRIIFITLYTLVFCCCFFGNLLVILVVTLSRRLRSITNFFLANLALADFCVGLFCVMQNLSIYLIDSWVFGEFLCRMYQFVHSLSYTASIFILVVICMERYFAIVHPITCKQILTAARLRMVILTVWITSAVYSTPKFVFSKTIKNVHTQGGREEEICVLDRKMFNSKLLDMMNFGLLYVIPLIVMTVLYSKIAIALWRSSRGLSHHHQQHQQQQQHHQQHDNGMNMHNSMYHHHSHHQQQQQLQLQQKQQHNHTQQLQQPAGPTISGPSALVGGTLLRKQSSKYEKRGVSISESQLDNCKVTLDADRPVVSTCRKASFYHHTHLQRGASTHGSSIGCTNAMAGNQRGSAGAAHMSHSSNNVLRARRGVVRMLIIFVLTFALCNLPYHARKMWQYWSRSYRGDSNFNALLTPLTFLVTYFNSGINPLLYAFLSRNFRKGMRELLLCSWKKGKGKSSSNSSMHHKRKALQTHSIPTDTTHIGNEQL